MPFCTSRGSTLNDDNSAERGESRFNRTGALHNQIGEAGAAALSEALKINATLTSL